MKTQLSTLGIIFLIIIIFLSGCIGQATKHFNNEFEADENTILQVYNINGPITITQWSGVTVSVDATMHSNIGEGELDNIDIEVTENNNIIDIETKYLGSGSVMVTTNMIMKVPNFVTIDTITSSNGVVRIVGTTGNITAHSSNGAIIIQEVDGYVAASTSNGRVEIKDTSGITNVHSSNGEINIELFDFKENITISTSNGDISVYINPSLDANIEMRTSNGKITLSEITLNVSTLEEEIIVGTLGEGGNTIDITTSNGHINLIKLAI